MIKHLFAISFIVLLVLLVNAQEGNIVNERMLWSNLREICEVGGNTYSTFFHRFEGDTIVGGKAYKKVYISEDEAAKFWSFTGELVREENGMVFYRDQFEKEALIYDFNLLPGDEVTITNPLAPEGLTLLVKQIDSVQTLDGYRKRWELILDEFSAPEYWIEGIGSESGVLNSGTGVFLGICGIYYLLCASVDGNQIYLDPEFQTCYYTLLDDGADFAAHAEQPTIKYLPQSRTVHINLPTKTGGKVMITSLSGSVSQHSDISPGLNIFNCSSYSPGIYVVGVINSKTLTSTKLIFY